MVSKWGPAGALEARFPLHVVCSWLGNSESTARKHYLKVQEKHFAEAASAGVFPSVQNMTASRGKAVQDEITAHEKMLRKSHSSASAAYTKYTPEDSNL